MCVHVSKAISDVIVMSFCKQAVLPKNVRSETMFKNRMCKRETALKVGVPIKKKNPKIYVRIKL